MTKLNYTGAQFFPSAVSENCLLFGQSNHNVTPVNSFVVCSEQLRIFYCFISLLLKLQNSSKFMEKGFHYKLQIERI